MPQNLLSLLLCGVTGKGSPPTGPIHSSLSKWWPLGRSMPRQVFSVFATPHFLTGVSSIIICLCGPGFSMIPRSVQHSFVTWCCRRFAVLEDSFDTPCLRLSNNSSLFTIHASKSGPALKHGIGNPETETETESNINDRKLKNFILHNLVQSKENLS